MILTGAQILELARIAGFQVEDTSYQDDLELDYNINVCSPVGIYCETTCSQLYPKYLVTGEGMEYNEAHPL